MGGKSKPQTTGYRYGLGMHFGIVDGTVDAVTQIVAGGRLAWGGNAVLNLTHITINAPNLFGGDSKEGGIVGSGDFELGGPAQVRNSYLKGLFGAIGPAYRKLTGFVWKGGLVTSNNPYIKPWSFRVVRILKGWDNDTPWYPEKATIVMPNGIKAMNPAHICYQIITSRRWGMQWPTSEIVDDVWRAAADRFYNEGFGLCFLWTQSEQIDEFLRIVCDHAGIVIRQRQEDGRFVIIPIRGDYDVTTLPVLDQTNILELDDFERNGGVDAINEIVAVYRDQVTNKDVPVPSHNLAAIQNSGAVISEERQYPGIPEANLAARVAERDVMQATASTSLMKCTTNRFGTSLLKGDLAVLNWPPLGISGMVVRILDSDSGQITDGRVVLNIAEDFYGLPNASYLTPQPSTWVPPNLNPQPIVIGQTFEATYRDLTQAMSDTELAAVDPTAGWLLAVAQRPPGVPFRFELYDRVSPAGFSQAASGDFTPNCITTTDISILQTVIPFSADYDMSLVQVGTVCLMGTEECRVDAVDLDNSRVTLARGCVDTVPKAWPSATRIWFYNDFNGADPTEYTSGETVESRLVTISGTGSMDVSQGFPSTMVMNARANRPYPAGRVLINGAALGGSLFGLITLAWSSRNRILQDNTIIDHTAASVTAEASTTYDLLFYDEGGLLKRSYVGLTTLTQQWDTEAADSGRTQASVPWFDSAYPPSAGVPVVTSRLNNSIRFTLTTKRGGVAAWQNYDVTIKRRGYGFNYGTNYGG